MGLLLVALRIGDMIIRELRVAWEKTRIVFVTFPSQLTVATCACSVCFSLFSCDMRPLSSKLSRSFR